MIVFLVEAQINIAPKANVSVLTVSTHKENPSSKSTDGNRLELSEVINGSSDIIAEFDKEYVLHYVIVYGDIQDERKTPEVPFYLSPGSGSYKRKPQSIDSSKGKRINIYYLDFLMTLETAVRLNEENFTLKEIEIYTLGSGNPNEKPMIYRGCFNEFPLKDIKGSVSFVNCGLKCSNSFIYAAFKEDVCYCGNEIDENDQQRQSCCNISRQNSFKTCGGNVGFSVYLVNIQLPTYDNCFTPKRRVVEDRQPIMVNMTISKCIRACDNHSHASLKAGGFCACRNETLGSKSTGCDAPCPGDPTKFCGGLYSLDVYTTCKTAKSLPCTKLFHCAGEFDEYGVCHGGCKSGYIGEYCLERGMIPEKEEEEQASGTPETHSEQKLIPLVTPFILAWTL